MENFDDFNIDDIFADVTSSTSLGEGEHENVRLLSIDIEKRKDRNNKPLKMQLFLKFKKYDDENNDIGEKEISFFLLDPAKESVINNLVDYLSQLKEILYIYHSADEVAAKFDPINGIVKAEGDDDYEDSDLSTDNIKKTFLNKNKVFKELEDIIKEQFLAMLGDKVGPDSTKFKLTLEESRDGKYIQLPRYSTFIEKMV